MINKLINYILIIMFMFVLLFLCIRNINALTDAISEFEKYRNVSSYLKQFDQIYKKNFYRRKELVDLYGISLLLFNKNTVLNFDMIKTKELVVLNEKSTKLNNHSINRMVGNVLSIYKIAQEHKIPFIYIQPPSAYHKVNQEVASLLNMKQHIVFNKIKTELKKTNTYYIDIYEILNRQNAANEKIFFRTDIHNTTFTEWETAREIIEYLEKIGITYNKQEKEKVLNILNYKIIKNDLYGNTIRSAGDYYTKKDIFETFIPHYDTKMQLYIENKKAREGSFQTVAMNGYEKLQKKRLYYVTNYGHFGKSLYTYENLNVSNDHNILIICDSLSMRTFSILSLINKKVTVYDPRFNKSDTAFKKILASNKYDAILFSTGTLDILLSKNYGLK